MRIGVVKEIKNQEYRVGMVAASVRELVSHGHEVFVETGAGVGCGNSDQDYVLAGATISTGAGDVFGKAELIVKVKEPQPEERKLLRGGHTIFTYLHLAPDRAQTEDLVSSGANCIAYETVTDAVGRLPLLAPMSEVAGRMSIQAGAMCLEKSRGGGGVLLGGVPGVSRGEIVIIGGGVVGKNAAEIAVGIGANVTILDRDLDVLRALDRHFGNMVQTLYSNRDSLEKSILKADLVVGAVLIPGATAPKLVSAELVKQMKAGSVLVDVAIDQGGCFETSHATTHDDPTYIVDDVVHYCVANMPGAVAQTSASALNNATLPYILELANKGLRQAVSENIHLSRGLNVFSGAVTNEFVAQAHGLDYVAPESILGAVR